MLHKSIFDSTEGEENTNKRMKMHENMKIKGTVVLMKKNLFELTNVFADAHDRFDEVLGHKVELQLISAVHIDSNGMLILFPEFHDTFFILVCFTISSSA